MFPTWTQRVAMVLSLVVAVLLPFGFRSSTSSHSSASSATPTGIRLTTRR